MRIYKRKGSPCWWVTWNDQNGKRNRRSSGTVNRKAAEALAAKWVEEGFMEQHFGKIWVERVDGKGSTFFLLFTKS